jgi:CRP-like cAMP-binding protein
MPETAPSIGLVERLLLLKKIALLSDLPSGDLTVLAGHVEERFFTRGSALLREGEPVGAIYVVVDGLVRCTRRGQALGDIGPGDGSVGGLAVFARDVDGIDARAVTDVLALAMDSETILEILEDRFTIAHHLLRKVSGVLVELLTRNPAPLGAAPQVPRHPAIPEQDLNLVERLLFLRQSPVFEHTSLNALAALSRMMDEVSFAAGDSVWHTGDPSGHVLLIISGSVAAQTADGSRFTLGPGTPLGSIESQAGRPRWYTAVAQSRMVALRGDAQKLTDVMEDNFEMALGFLAVISRWLLVCLENTPGADLRSFFGGQSAAARTASP